MSAIQFSFIIIVLMAEILFEGFLLYKTHRLYKKEKDEENMKKLDRIIHHIGSHLYICVNAIVSISYFMITGDVYILFIFLFFTLWHLNKEARAMYKNKEAISLEGV